jgi:hypothetical protein
VISVKEHTITYHIKEIYKSEELEKKGTARKIRVVRVSHGDRCLGMTQIPVPAAILNNIYKCEELLEESTCSILEHMGNDGKQLYSTKYYNLDAIISVGFRVNTKRGIEFRQWAKC